MRNGLVNAFRRMRGRQDPSHDDGSAVPAADIPATGVPATGVPAAGEGAAPPPPPARRRSPRSFHRIRSSTGDVLSADVETGRVVARPARPGETLCELVMILPVGAMPYGFLAAAAPIAPALRMGHDPSHAAVLSYVLDRTAVPERIAFRDPNSAFYLCATPVAVAPEGDVNCNRDRPGGWEGFTVEALDPNSLAPHLAELATELEAVLSAPLSAAGLRALALGAPAERTDRYFAALVRLLDRENLWRFAGLVLNDAPLRERTRSLLPGGDWHRLLCELARWNRDREPLERLVLDASWDRIQKDVTWGRPVPLGEILLVLAREHVDPRRELCVMTCARNEGIYFLEWIAHYRALGVEHFFVYSNDNDDGSDELLGRLAELGIITWIDNRASRGVDFQTRAYKHGLTYLHQPLDFRWTLIVDLDEFVVLNPARYWTLTEFLRLQESRGAEAVAMNWVVYTPGRETSWSPRPMIERFHTCENNQNEVVKTAFLTRLHTASYPHNPIGSFWRYPLYLAANGRLHHGLGSPREHSHSGTPNFEDAWVAHYYFKSAQEFMWKIARGHDQRRELSFDSRRLIDYLRCFELTDVVKDLRALPHLGPLRQELVALRRLPGLQAIEKGIQDRFADRTGAMKQAVIRWIETSPEVDSGLRDRLLRLLGVLIET